MLTNNKKRSFVKLIALAMAALMVFSVCLTGCTDEDARTAAQGAQDAADAAQSAADAAQSAADAALTDEEVAAKITAALADYLKKADALAAADVDAKVNEMKAAIEASLKDYAKKADVDNKQDKGNYATKDDLNKKQDKIDLSGYAKSSDVKKVADDLAAHIKSAGATITTAQVQKIVNDALAEIDLDSKINAALAKVDTLTAEEVQDLIDEAVAEVLENYYTKDEVDALIEEKIEAIMIGDYTTKQVADMLATFEKAMTTAEWNQATLKVVSILDSAKALFKELYENSYKQDSKKAINDLMAKISVPGLDAPINTDIVVFKSNTDGSLKDFEYDYMHANGGTVNTVDATSKILTQLTVHILRAPSVEYLNAIQANITAAYEVDNFADEMNRVKARLYDLGELAQVDDNMKDGADKYTTSTNGWSTTYHGKTYKKGDVKVAQVVTVADQAEFNAIEAYVEKLVLAYALEADNFKTYYGFSFEDVYGEWADEKGNKSYKPAGYYEGEAWTGDATIGNNWKSFGKVDLAAKNTKYSGNKSSGDGSDKVTFKGYHIGIDNYLNGKNVGYNYADPFTYTVVTPGYHMINYYDTFFFEPKIRTDLSTDEAGANEAYTTAGKFAALLEKFTVSSANAELSTTYAAIKQMLKDAKEAVDEANKKFVGTEKYDVDETAFLPKIGYNHSHSTDGKNTCNCSLWGDSKYLSELKDYMCEETESDKQITVPSTKTVHANTATTSSDWTEGPWLSPVEDVKGVNGPWLSSERQANTVEVYMNYALNINGKTHNADSFDAITKYDLYLDMIDQAWNLLYDKYQIYAAEVLQKMVNDYTIAVNTAYAIKPAPDAVTVYGNYLSSAAATAAAMGLYNKDKSEDIIGVWDTKFLPAFFTYTDGTTDFSWKIGNKVVKVIGPTHTFKGFSQYYANNGAAVVPTIAEDGSVVGTPVISDVLAAMAAHVETFGANNNVYTELSTVSLDPRDKILMKGEDWSAWIGSDEVVGESVFSHKKNDKSILRVQDAFDAELALAKANLDEIIYRYTFVEIKDALLNDLYAYVDGTGDVTVFTKGTSTFVTYPNNVYAAGNKGIAPYFWQDTTTETAPQYVLDAMVDILKNYVTGYNDNVAADKQTAYTANIIKDNGVVVDTVVTWLNEDAQTVLKTLNGYNLPSNIVTDEYKAYANIIDLTYTATDLIEAVEDEIDAAVMDLANEAVEYRFNDYIKDARDALLFAHMSYEVAAPTYEVAYKLKKAYNENLDQITSVEYLWNIGIMGKSDTMTHFNAFTGSLLGTVISYNSPYYGLLSEGATLKEQLKTVKSTTTLTNDLTTFKDGDAALAYASKWNPAQADFGKKGVAAQYPVSVTTSATGLLNKYNATGSAVVAFDKILNAGAKNFDGASLY